MNSEQVIVFELQGQEFGIDITKVLEIQECSTIRSIPGVPNYIEGIINVRGTIYPIINLKKRLHLSSNELDYENKFILLNTQKNHTGFIVDKVSEILTIASEETEGVQEILEKNHISCVERIVKKESRLILVLNTDVIISDEEDLVLEDIQEKLNIV